MERSGQEASEGARRGAARGGKGYDVAVIGASWGGLTALTAIVSALPADFGVPVVIVQHRRKDSENLLADLLQDETPLTVSEVEDKEPMIPGHIYVAPADYHLLVEGDHFSLSCESAVRYSRPSIDVTFISAADTHEERVIGVVLTGANEDGARGLKRICERGGMCIVQDPATAEVRTMPEAALKATPSAWVLGLDAIAPQLARLAGKAATPAVRPPKPPASPASRRATRGGEMRL